MDSSFPSKNETNLPSLGRQSSIYSLTLDEFQHTLSEHGKNFGSMNMDEFLNSIWTAEENQAQSNGGGGPQFPPQESNGSSAKGIAKQHSLPRQGSVNLTIPEPLCRKTVEEVWSEIHNDRNNSNGGGGAQNPSTAQKQATFGEMTLEDFLVRAGVVREENYAAAPPPPPQQPPFGIFQNNGTNFAARPVIPVASYQSGVGEAQCYGGGMKRGNGYSSQPPPPPVGGYGGRLGMGSPVSPLSDGNQYGVDGMRGGGGGGRKRVMDGPVVERRQRRMIKNRESAARSRARKQAYTVELEAELNQLKEENLHLKQVLGEMERKRKQQYYEEEKARRAELQTKSYRGSEKLRRMRRSMSSSV